MMYALSAVIHRQVIPVCQKNYAVCCGVIRWNYVNKGETLLHIFTRKHHNKVLLCDEKSLVINGQQQVRSIHKHDVIPQDFFPQYTKDNVPRDYLMIYQSKLGSQQVNSTWYMGGGIIFYCAFVIFLALKMNGYWTFDEKIEIPGVNWTVPLLGLEFYGGFAFFILLWLNISIRFSMLPVRRIYQSPDKQKYIGIFSRFPWSSQRIEFNLNDVQAVPVKSGSALRKGNASVKGKKCMFFAADFKDVSYFNKVIGNKMFKKEKIKTKS